MESFGGYATAGTSHLRFPEDLSYNTDYAGHYMMFTAMKVSGGVDTRTLKFALAEGAPTRCMSTYTTRFKCCLSKQLGSTRSWRR